jgi:hypothetical protein
VYQLYASREMVADESYDVQLAYTVLVNITQASSLSDVPESGDPTDVEGGLDVGANVDVIGVDIDVNGDQEDTYQTMKNITVYVNLTGPRWFQTKEQCIGNVTGLCKTLGAGALSEPPLCQEDFLCSSDSLYTAWTREPGKAGRKSYARSAFYIGKSLCQRQPEPVMTASFACSLSYSSMRKHIYWQKLASKTTRASHDCILCLQPKL